MLSDYITVTSEVEAIEGGMHRPKIASNQHYDLTWAAIARLATTILSF